MILQQGFTVTTQGRGTCSITDCLSCIVRASDIRTGLAHLFVHHTSASLILCENADPTVRQGLERFMSRLIPDSSPWLQHDEGPDDMPAHIRAILTQSSLTVPILDGRRALGDWQGVYLWEHRRHGHDRPRDCGPPRRGGRLADPTDRLSSALTPNPAPAEAANSLGEQYPTAPASFEREPDRGSVFLAAYWPIPGSLPKINDHKARSPQ